MKHTSYASVIWKEGRYYVSQCLDVEVSSFGKTKKEAIENLEEALGLYFENTRTKRYRRILRPELTRVFARHVA